MLYFYVGNLKLIYVYPGNSEFHRELIFQELLLVTRISVTCPSTVTPFNPPLEAQLEGGPR